MTARDYDWPNGARLALSLVVNVEEGAEHRVADGDRGPEPVDELLPASPRSLVRNHGNESNYQYGIRAAAPRILTLLDRHGMAATWTAAALALERAPWLAQAIVARGDEICCHGYRWATQFHMDETEERAFIVAARDSITRTSGTAPVGWLSRYLHTDITRRLLSEEGFTYHMDDFSDDQPFWDTTSTKPIVVLPYALDSNDMKMWTAPGLTPDDWLHYAIDTFDWLYAEGGNATRMMSLGTHLRIIGRPGRIGALDRFLDHVSTKPDVWIACRREIAAHFAAKVAA